MPGPTSGVRPDLVSDVRLVDSDGVMRCAAEVLAEYRIADIFCCGNAEENAVGVSGRLWRIGRSGKSVVL